MPSGRRTTLKAHSQPMYCMAFAPDGQRLATACSDKTVAVWDVATCACVYKLSPADFCNAVAYSPDGRYLAVGIGASSSGQLRVYNAQTGKEICKHEHYSTTVSTVAFSADGTRLATGCYDGFVRVYDTSSFSLLLSFKAHTDQQGIWGLQFAPRQNDLLLSASHDSTVKLWQLIAGGASGAFTYGAYWPCHTRGV